MLRIIKSKARLIMMFSCITIVSCSSKNDHHLQIRHSFEATHDVSAKDGFDFLMTWFVPPEVLFGNQQNTVIANMGLVSRPQPNPRLEISNETRLRLEDIAVKRLEQ